MTLQWWLMVATADLPAEVVARVRAESAGHVQDAVEAGEPEALAVQALGDPECVHRELHCLYLNDARLRALRQEPPRLSVALAWGMPPVYGLLMVSIELFFPVGSVSGWRLIAPGLVLLTMALLWSVTSRQTAERRTLWRTFWTVQGPQVLVPLHWTLQGWYGEPITWAWFIPVFWLIFLGQFLFTLREDLRLRRTLGLGSSTGRGGTGTC